MLVIGTDNWIGKYIYDYLNKNSSFHNTEIKIDNIIKNKKPYNDFNSIKQNLKSLIIEYKNNPDKCEIIRNNYKKKLNIFNYEYIIPDIYKFIINN